ncbi:MAG: toll/interleukin-1 receptor domain-containing protein, partial [Bacteroidaceae bacterium]|nr:toll/interleukin-1 receptor domain-containing protein [Bacteroidaceae bacterium]
MEKKNERIFISYKRVDKDRVDALRKDIEQATDELCWIDRDGIESDAQFVEVIMKAIDQCEVFLFMRSKEHNNITNYRTDWTIREVNYALEEKKRIIFISLDNTPLPRWFKFMFPQQQETDASDATKLKRFYADLRSWLKVEEKKEKSAPVTRIT